WESPGRRRAGRNPSLWTGADVRRRTSWRVGRHRERAPHRRHGPVGLRQVDPDAHPRGPGQADRRLRRGCGPGDHEAQRRRSDEAPARAHRLRVPVPRRRADCARDARRVLARGHHDDGGDRGLTRFALRGLLSRKLRTALTAIAIVLGVGMISGTFVLTDSISHAFDRIFTDARKGSDAVISGKSAFDTSSSDASLTPTFDESLLSKVRQQPGVAQAEGSVSTDSAHLIDKNGKVIQFGLGGAPNLGFSIANGKSPFNPLSLVDGTWPGPNQVVIDKETASKKHLETGQDIRVQVEGPVRTLRISGIVQFSSGLTIGGATIAGFDLPTAQRRFAKRGRLDEIAVAAKPTVSDAELVKQIRPILPPDAEVRTAPR